MQCLIAVFKKDTKEKNQKKAEAKKRKAEQQEQQEPVDDNIAVTNAEGNPTAATHLLEGAQLPVQQPAQPSLQQPPAQAQLPPASSEHNSSNQVDNGLPKESVTEQNM